MRSGVGIRYPALMVDEDDSEARGLLHWVNERRGVIIGLVGLIAWFAMLWFMFGDVL